MSLAPGTRLGPYEILSPIGAGGMGEVYRAKDTKLNRDVAIKVLPESFALDADRVARFTREAQVLASLNHPNIAQIYGIEENAIVMELVEGQDLSALIARGPIALPDALPVAKQIADALEAAHEQGIVHRDLKPQNIKVKADGMVKVLDFGLAKAVAPDGATASADAMNSPTMTVRATQMGMIIGTAAYMSPEQARGRAVDRRADIWAFGVVFFEMLTGHRAFKGDDVSELLASVLRDTPDLSILPASVPRHVRALLQRCLEKDPKQRLRDIGEARLALSGSAPVDVEASAKKRGPLLVAAFVVSALAAGVFFGSLYLARQALPSAGGARLVAQIVAPPDVASAFSNGFALSPDGQLLAFSARNKAGVKRVWLRRLDTDAAHEVPGTDGGSAPFWAPDSRTFGFFADGTLKRVDIEGASLQSVCETDGQFLTGSWSTHDEILWASLQGARQQVHKVPASGGASVTLDALGGRVQAPIWLLNGQKFLYIDGSKEAPELRMGSADGASSTPIPAVPRSEFYGYGGGFLFLNRNGALTAQRFDERSGSVVGPAVPIASIAANMGRWFAVTTDGDRVIALLGNSGNATARLIWVDRQGNQVGSLGAPGPYWQQVPAPDGKSALVSRSADFEWLRPDAPPLRVTSDGPTGTNLSPVWHSSGTELLYMHLPSTIIRRPVDPQGHATTVIENVFGAHLESWSRDGRWLLFSATPASSKTDAIFVYDFTTKTQRPWLANEFVNRSAQLSPDGKWVAYSSNASGRMELYLRAFEGEGQPIAVSAEGGGHPFWRGDGNELFYLGSADQLMSVSVTRSGSAIVPGKPKQLFHIPLNDVATDSFAPYGVSPDGQRFLLNVVERPAPLFLLQGLASIVK